MPKRDYYEILNASREATKDEIRNAYRKLALKYHPDRNKSPEAEERFKEISEAYAVLSDDEKRRQYDQFGHAGIDQRYTYDDIFRGVDFDDILRDLGFGFGGFGSIFDMFFGSRGGRGEVSRGRDIRYDLEITLEQAYSGHTAEIQVPRRERCVTCRGTGAKPGASPRKCGKCGGTGQIQHVQSRGFMTFSRVEPCDRCRGKGTIIDSPCNVCRGAGVVQRSRRISVKVPRGVDASSHLILRGEGEAGENGGHTGDLYVVINVRPHEIFERGGRDLHCKVPVKFSVAALGGEVPVPTLDGPVSLKVPPGTQSGALFRLRGKGMPSLRDGRRGDQLVSVQVQTPVELTDSQRDLISRLAQEGL